MLHASDNYNRIQDPENKIPADEPVFLLRGQDVIAPLLLLIWAYILRIIGGDYKLAESIIKHSIKMTEWQKTHKKKIPDNN